MSAQPSLVDRLHTMQQNPKLKERVFIHTNKTSYFPDDVIWLKAYVGDSINYPSVETQVLSTKLFDQNGTQMLAKNIAIENGTGIGEFELNNSVPPGLYYLQAQTNYMRNFGEDYQYLQEILVLGNEAQFNAFNDLEYNIQMFPEGGNLIEGISNVVGIKVLLNGKGIDFEGILVNKSGKTITSFINENHGMGKLSFVYEKGEVYQAHIKLQDTILRKVVPSALSEGIALHVDSSNKDNLKVFLKTNEATFFKQIYSNYKLLFRQNRQIFDLISVARLDSLTGLIEINKNIFLDGVHTVTLFADDQPIAERKFYIETSRKSSSVSLKKQKMVGDSITYLLDFKARNKGLTANLSVSILPEPEVVEKNNTIQDTFLLTLFLKGHIENPAYYFNSINKKRKEHLDLLLLTQGWSRYSLNEIIQEINPNERYSFQEGFELKGKLTEEVKHKNLVLIPNDFRIIDKVALRGKSKFTFQNLKVFKGDTIRVAYQNWFGRIIKASPIAFDTTVSRNFSKLNVPKKNVQQDKLLNANGSSNSKVKYVENNKEIAPLRNADGTIALDEVIVSEKKRSESYLRRRKIISKYKPMVKDIGRYREIPITDVFKNYEHDLISFLKASEGANLNITNPMDVYLEDPNKKEALLFIDGQLVNPDELNSIPLSMKNIANVMVTSRWFIVDGRIFKGTVYQIFTTDEYRNNSVDLFDKFVIKNGYDKAKKYYRPLYNFNQASPINLFEVDWKPNLKTNSKGEVYFKVAKSHKAKKLLFSIQGFSNTGHLISETIIMD